MEVVLFRAFTAHRSLSYLCHKGQFDRRQNCPAAVRAADAPHCLSFDNPVTAVLEHGRAVVVVSCDEGPAAFDRLTGAELWSADLKNADSSSACIGWGSVWTTVEDRIVGWNLADGTQSVRFDESEFFFSDDVCAIQDNLVFWDKDSYSLIAFSPSRGAVSWRFVLRHWVQSCFASDGTRLWVGDDQGGLYCVSVATGDLLWDASIAELGRVPGGGPSRLLGTPSLVDGAILAQVGNNQWVCLDSESGDLLWSQDLLCLSRAPWVDGPDLIFVDGYHRLIRIDALTGRVKSKAVLLKTEVCSCTGGFLLGNEVVATTRSRIDFFDRSTLRTTNSLALKSPLDEHHPELMVSDSALMWVEETQTVCVLPLDSVGASGHRK